MRRATGDPRAPLEGLLLAVESGEARQKGGMDVDDPAFKSAQEFALQDPHETRQQHQINPGVPKRVDIGALCLIVQLRSEFPRRNKLRRQSSFAGPLEDAGPFNVAQDEDDLGRDFSRMTGLGKGHQV